MLIVVMMNFYLDLGNFDFEKPGNSTKKFTEMPSHVVDLYFILQWTHVAI